MITWLSNELLGAVTHASLFPTAGLLHKESSEITKSIQFPRFCRFSKMAQNRPDFWSPVKTSKASGKGTGSVTVRYIAGTKSQERDWNKQPTEQRASSVPGLNREWHPRLRLILELQPYSRRLRSQCGETSWSCAPPSRWGCLHLKRGTEPDFPSPPLHMCRSSSNPPRTWSVPASLLLTAPSSEHFEAARVRDASRS